MGTSFDSTPLFPIHVVSMKRTASVSLANALKAVQNPSLMIHLNPLVISCTQDEEDECLWHIRDTIKMMGYSMLIEYRARIVKTADGVDVSSKAGMGTLLSNYWRVRAVASGVEISEEVQIQAFRPLMPFIIRTLRISHRNLLHRLVDQLDKEDGANLASS